jgi:tetrahedral aminopeptidase
MELLKKLTAAYGPSGNEEGVAEIIIESIKDCVDEVKRDRLGNVIALKKGKGSGKIMVSAHMDQIGVLVTSIDKNGFLRFTDVGYVMAHASIGKTVIFKNGVKGIVAKEEKKELKELKLEGLYIDIGASSKEEAQNRVKIGDFGVFSSEFVVNGDRISAGALDDRAGCYAAIEAARRVKGNEADIYFTFTVQEESYLSGAATSAYAIEPDCAIVIDVTDTGDTPNCPTMAVKLGEGAAIKVMDRGMICHPTVKRLLVETAEKNGIKYQFEVLEAGATDGAEIHVSRTGVPTGAISIPTRYIHTPQELIDMKDLNSCIELLVRALEDYR